MSQFTDGLKPEFDKIVDFFKKEIASLRVGRASPSIVENIKINAYGALMPLMQLASVQNPEPRTLVIQPWDKSLTKDIEKGITAADLGVNPVVDGEVIRINFPSLTEETRKEVVKKLHHKMEDSRVSIRNHREKLKEEINEQEKNKLIAEDDKYKRIEELDELVKDYNNQVKELSDKKEQEVMTV